MKWIMVDLETTGLDPGYHEIIEAGFVSSEGRELSFSLSFDEAKADPVALKINGWPDRIFATTMFHHEALAAVDGFFDDLMGEEGPQPYLIGWPAQFDVGFLTRWYGRHNARPPWHYRHVIDVRSFASAIWGPGCDLSESWAEGFGIEPNDGPHEALADARYQAKVWAEILRTSRVAP